jgi:hypothetical protein
MTGLKFQIGDLFSETLGVEPDSNPMKTLEIA